ncbi:uncharacterized protein BJ212DRAFT_1588349 [Suillus subaureus]|uniref:Uncharacterized protein n=1 Tax=Suillus subaureus TaxID=48587 RepID=A0A9P7E8H1_9AGAM|nr:uncharacterized protein BJ212DRAFT_1588349 [Suillus subaureus]KAG1814311.1 hypothetical protein BJ212DRAFT_1588349 [Suillus subaureus]
MAFGEVVHYVTQPTDWPEPVRGIASLLSPFHCPNWPSNEHLASTSSSKFPEPLSSNEAPAPGSYTAKDFQALIHSTAAGLSALAELPHYGGERSTVPHWSQLLHALANTLSPDVLILEDAPFIMPRSQNMTSQPSNLIDGHATLLAAHAIYSTPRTPSDSSTTSSQDEEDNDESMSSADFDSCDGSVDSLDLPLQAHMLPGRGRRLSAVVPVLLVADSHNIVPLLCSALYQRHVWGIRQPVVGLCCSSTGTIATAIFGWLDSDQSEEGRMASPKSMHIFPRSPFLKPTAHLALAADIRLDPSIGVFDFSDTRSAISLAQFVLGLRTHFQDIKDATSIEAVDSLTPLHWRSDLPEFETQFLGQLDERVASWTHQVHVQTTRQSSSSSPRTPSTLDTAVVSYETMSPSLLRTIVEDEQVHGANIWLPQKTRATNVKGRGSHLSSKRTSASPQPLPEDRILISSHAPSLYPNSQFTALSDTGIKDSVSISNWLFERHAFTVGRIPLRSEEQANKTGINAMVKIYDEMTAFTWSDDIKTTLSNAKVDIFVSDIRTELCDTKGDPNYQSSAIDVPSSEDVEFISCRISVLLHAVKGARSSDDVARLHGANEAYRRHEWDALLLNFFQPVLGQRDVLLERHLNFARNLAADDPSFATRTIEVALEYQNLCLEQHRCVRLTAETSSNWTQTAAARDQAIQFSDDIERRDMKRNFGKVIAYHSSKDPIAGKCDAILVIPCSSVATAIPGHISGIDKQEKLLKSFMLVQGPKLEKLDASTGEASYQIEKTDRAQLHNPFLYHPDGNRATQKKATILSQDTSYDEPSGQDLLLPVLLAEYKKRDESAISTAMNQMKTYLVSAVTFLSEFGITDQPVFGLVVNGALGAITMAWKRNNQIYVMERNVRHYDIRDPLQALQFVSILPRLARYSLGLRRLLEKQLATIDVKQLQSKPWSKLAQRQEDERLAATKRTESEGRSLILFWVVGRDGATVKIDGQNVALSIPGAKQRAAARNINASWIFLSAESLASSLASYMTGHTLEATGGRGI